MDTFVRRISWPDEDKRKLHPLLDSEWLTANGLGGYACGTVAGCSTRRYHGLLVAAHPAPLGRMMILNHLSEFVRLPNWKTVPIGGVERVDGTLDVHGVDSLIEFRLDQGLPVWRYEVEGCTLEKRVFMPHHQNTTFLQYRLLAGPGPVRLKLRPSVHFRGHDAAPDTPLERPYRLSAVEDRYEIFSTPTLPVLRLRLHGRNSAFTLRNRLYPDVFFRVEQARGYEHTGSLWSPGEFRVELEVGGSAALVASTEPWERVLALQPDEALHMEFQRRQHLLDLALPAAQSGLGAELVLAADQFLITPAGRVEDTARAHAAGDEVRTVIAGYHWFTDWGRDTMISLEGLTLCTGRHAEAGYILRAFARYVRDGLLPNLFPEGETHGLYHTADATLWYFHALHRYLMATGDVGTLRLLLPTLLDIAEHHLRGTRFGIGVDPRDGLLRQGAEGYQLTWMDAKVGDWVVTPRRGKAVEINALWYNALRLLERWVSQEQGDEAARRWHDLAEKTYDSFQTRFWYESGGHLYDIVDGERGDDASLRPNQILALSLDHPVLAQERWQPVLESTRTRLLTPVGLRSLAPGHPDYKSKYYGDLRARDAAYHQGTVWAWLIGPFVDAWLRVHPGDRAGARRCLEGFANHLSEACAGSVSEVFDAEAPYTPRGCVAQAWSVAEVLRAWVKTADFA